MTRTASRWMQGDVFIADSGRTRVVEVPVDRGAQTTIGASLDGPGDVAVAVPAPTFTATLPGSRRRSVRRTPITSVPRLRAATPSGEPTATFSVSSGQLPPGLKLHRSTGVLSGTPTKAGNYTFTVESENAANGTVGRSATVTVTGH
jgi:Putative Ig domain